MANSSKENDTDAMDDFVDHLQRRLGLNRYDAVALLGDWVSHYQPQQARLRQQPNRVLGTANHALEGVVLST